MWESAGLPLRRLSKSLFPTRWLWFGHLWTNHCHQRNVIKPGPELHEWEVGSVFFLPLRLRVGRSGSPGNTSEQLTVVSLRILELIREKDMTLKQQEHTVSFIWVVLWQSCMFGKSFTAVQLPETVTQDYYPKGEEGEEIPRGGGNPGGASMVWWCCLDASWWVLVRELWRAAKIQSLS